MSNNTHPIHKIGVIGAGPNAAAHAHYFAQTPRAQVVAIADLALDRAHTLAQAVGASAVADFREFLSAVDAVVVSSPNFLHAEHAVAVAEAGKHLYCEKPLGLNLVEARIIAAAVEKSGVASVVGFSPRFSAEIQTMIRLAREGALGQLISLTSRRLMWIDQSEMPAWRGDHGKSGGLLLEINIHELDWLLRAACESGAGEVQTVYARLWAAQSGSRRNDHVWVVLGFAGATTASHEGSWMASNAQFFREIQGTKAAVATNEWGNELYFAPLGQNRVPQPLDADFDLRAHFLDCIEGAEPVCDVQWGVKVMRTVEAVFESAQTGQVVQLSHD